MARIGLLGGSFNPAHGAHRHISLVALQQLKLDAVWWLVSPLNPLKSEAGMAPLPKRLARAKAVAHHPRIKVMALEEQLGTRFAVDTVTALRRRFLQHQFVWIGGSDIVAELHRWQRWRQFLRAVPLAVVPRPGSSLLGAPALAWAGKGGSGWSPTTPSRWTEAALPAIISLHSRLRPESATKIRSADPGWATDARFDEKARSFDQD